MDKNGFKKKEVGQNKKSYPNFFSKNQTLRWNKKSFERKSTLFYITRK